jgi:hypothetical protein
MKTSDARFEKLLASFLSLESSLMAGYKAIAVTLIQLAQSVDVTARRFKDRYA